MTSYLTQETIKDALVRLGQSRAKPLLLDYLVFKRAQVEAGDDAAAPVVTGITADAFMSAIVQLARVQDAATGTDRFFSPFGYTRDRGRGYKSDNFHSNGPSVNVASWGSRAAAPIQYVPDTRPKEFRFVDRTADEFEHFMLIGAKADVEDKPRLTDLAVWMHRSADVSAHASGDAVSIDSLVAATRSLFRLTDEEIAGIFSQDGAGELLPSSSTASETAYLPVAPTSTRKAPTPTTATAAANVGPDAVDGVVQFVAAKGFVFDPWQIAAFVTAVRTKPFVILAGISGTGKTKLPKLVAKATGAEFRRIPVRPDWTDSSELLGYERLGQGTTFVPGLLLRVAREAQENPKTQFFVLLDEMNVARVEYYLAEVLSHLEERTPQADGSIASDPLVETASDPEWANVRLPGNLTIVGSVNMDETTFGFSRKVLDRSFVIEFSTVSLSTVKELGDTVATAAWPAANWQPTSLSLAEHPDHGHPDVGRVIAALETINDALSPMQMQVGYRVRDEIAMFVLSALDCPDSFVGDDESVINPLDLAIAMKVLPRIQGTGPTLRTTLETLLGWANPTTSAETTTGLETESFPFCTERLTMMLRRLDDTGFTSFWL